MTIYSAGSHENSPPSRTFVPKHTEHFVLRTLEHYFGFAYATGWLALRLVSNRPRATFCWEMVKLGRCLYVGAGGVVGCRATMMWGREGNVTVTAERYSVQYYEYYPFRKRLTNSIEESSSWETYRLSATQEILLLLWSLEVQCCFQNSPKIVAHFFWLLYSLSDLYLSYEWDQYKLVTKMLTRRKRRLNWKR